MDVQDSYWVSHVFCPKGHDQRDLLCENAEL